MELSAFRGRVCNLGLSVYLAIWCGIVFWRIHYRRLDYSLDPSLLGLCTSRAHIGICVLVGAVWLPVDFSIIRQVAGSGLVIWYTVRNFKHLRSLNKRFEARGVPSPGFWRSSMVRQQMQVHVGVGIGGVAVCALGAEPAPTNWPLWVLSALSALIGAIQLFHAPLPESDVRRNLAWAAEDSETPPSFGRGGVLQFGN